MGDLKKVFKRVIKTTFMKNLKVLFIGLFFILSFFGYSQYCGTATSNVTITPTTTSQLTASYSTGIRAFNFVATAGCVYEFSTCSQTTMDTYLRLYSTGTGGTLLASNDDFCSKQSTLTWTATVNGTVSILLTRFSCNAINAATKMSYRRVSCSPPSCVTPISPTDASTGIFLNQTLSWNSSSIATSYDVYFGTNSSPPFVVNQTGTTYNPGTLSYNTTYYWKIIPKNSNGSPSCSTWSFTTSGPGCLNAPNGQYPSTTFVPSCNGTNQAISTACYAGEYSLVNLTSGINYTFSSSISTDYITISDANGTTVLAYGTGSVSYQPTSNANYRFYTHTNSFCGSSTTARTRSIQCTQPPPPSNDACSGAIDVGLCGGTLNGSTQYATNGDGTSCYTAPSETWLAPGVWYKVVGNGQNITASTCSSSFDTKIFVYTGTCSGLTCLSYNDDYCSTQSQVTFASTLNTTYYILVTGYGSSKGAFTLSVTLNPSPPAITTQPQGNTICLGQSHTFSVTSTGNQGPLSYQWYLNNTIISGATSPTYSTNVAGNYYVKVTNSCGANTQSNSVTLTVLSPPSLSTSVSDISCSGGGNGSIDLIVSGLGSPFSFNWTGPNGFTSTSEDITNLSTGIYTVTVTNYIGCQSSKTVTVSEPSSLVLTLVGSNVPCYGQSSGNIDLTVSGGTPPYSYLWSNGSTSQDLSNLSSGTYTINVTDNNNCVATSSLIISQPSTPISLSTQLQNVSCYNGNNGSIDLTVNGGTPPFTYSWSNSSTSEDLSGITIGTYSVVVKDNNGCQEITTVNITQPTDINISMNVQNVNCYGQSTGMIYTNVSGGTPTYTYSWSNGSTSQNLTYIIAGSYTVNVTDGNGCVKTKDTTITQNPQIVVSITKTNVTCNGYNDGSISASVSGGVPPYIYTWAHGPTTPSIYNLNSGNYTLYVTDSKGCTKSTMIYISQPQPLVVSVNSPTISSCQSTPPVLLTATVNGGTPNYNYIWSNGATTNAITVLPTVTTVYTVQVTDVKGCIGIGQSTVTVSQNVGLPPIGSVTGPTQAYPYMVSGNVATYSVSPVVGATNYTWYIPTHGVFFVTNSDSNVVNVTINSNFTSNSNGGEFFVEVTNGCDIKYSDTLKVVVLEDPIIIGSNCGIPSGVINTYHVQNSLPGLTYNWIRPYGTNMYSGQGNDTCKIKFSQYMQSPSTLSVSVSTVYGTVYGSLEILKNSTPPTYINGETSVCANNSAIYEYYVDSVSTATGYIWNVPNGAILIDGQGNDTVHVKYNTTFVSGSMNVQSYNQCGSSAMTYLSVSNNNLSLPIGPISGAGDLCPYLGSTTTYSVQLYQGYTYTWVIPQGFTIVSGQGTNIITVLVSPSFTSGTISVQMNEGCGSSQPTSLNLSTTQTTINTSNISGPTTVCTIVGTTQTATYSITPVSGVNYNWSVPTNASIVSGQNSNLINVSFQVGFNGGNINVLVSGGCSQPVTKTITLVTNPPNVNSISGVRCIENNTTYNYSVPLVTGALSYNWTVPGNATITGGQGTNQISVFYPSNFETTCLNNLCDSLRLTVQFSCGFRKKAVQIGMTTYPVTTIYGPTSTCPPDTIQLSASTSLRATNYFWGSPNGTQFVNLTGLSQANLGQTVNSKINTTFLGGNFNVQTINQCGSTAMRYFYVSKTCAAKIMGDTITNVEIFDEEWQKSLSDPIDFVIFPNPTKGLLQLRVFRGNEEYYMVTITNNLGLVVYQKLKEKEDDIDISNLASGIYTINLMDKNSNTISKQIIVF